MNNRETPDGPRRGRGRPAGSGAAGITAEKYAAMLRAFIELPSPSRGAIVRACDGLSVTPSMVDRALSTGWPKVGLPPISEASQKLIDPVAVHELMAGMLEQKKIVFDNMFQPLPGNLQAPTAAGVNDATQQAAEHGMAARIAMSSATASARAIEAVAQIMLQKVINGEVEIPEKVRLEHILLLARASDTAAGAIHRALQIEKLRTGQPESIVGIQIATLLVDATAEELKLIAETGQIPPRLMGIAPKTTGVMDVTAIDISDPDDDENHTDGGPAVNE